jgi:hypothetical protein
MIPDAAPSGGLPLRGSIDYLGSRFQSVGINRLELVSRVGIEPTTRRLRAASKNPKRQKSE